MKNANSFCIVLQDTSIRFFISCSFTLAFTPADIVFCKFLELHSTLSKKKDFPHFFSFLTD